jgi:hypothetical protein
MTSLHGKDIGLHGSAVVRGGGQGSAAASGQPYLHLARACRGRGEGQLPGLHTQR